MQEPESTVENGAPVDTSPISPVRDAPLPSQPPEPPTPAAADRPSLDEATKKAVDNVLYSDIGVSTLLNRLKQSIASVKDFASFLKKRSGTEDEHAKELRRLCRTTHQDIRKAESRQGSYSRQFEAVTNLHERMAENGMQFALNLHQMHEDLNQLSFEMEKGRKNWKQIGLSAEQKASDAEKQMEKAKQKYDSLADQYDHAKTGDGGRHFGLRGMKSAEQREEELKDKVEMSDKDYQSKVQYARQQRQELLEKTRPQAVKAIQDLISECDAGLALQMQKFAVFNERLMLGNGLLVSPLNEPNAPQQRSMRDLVLQIDNQQDFQSYIRSFGAKIPPRSGNIEYRQHPTLAPKGQPYKASEPQPQTSSQPAPLPKDNSPTLNSPGAPTFASGAVQPPSFASGANQPPSSFPSGPNQPPPPFTSGPNQPPPSFPSGPNQSPPSFASGANQPPSAFPSSASQPPPAFGSSGNQAPPSFPMQQYGASAPEYNAPPVGPGLALNTFHSSSSYDQEDTYKTPTPSGPPGPPGPAPPPGPPPAKATSPGGYGPPPGPPPAKATSPGGFGPPPGVAYPGQPQPYGRSGYPTSPTGPPAPVTGAPVAAAPRPSTRDGRGPPGRPVFGYSLDELFRRDQSPVPIVVYQCIQAVELFGLDNEGIYRISGNATQIADLKGQFNYNAERVDFRNPEAFFHDVNNASNVLKLFLRELPDPLFTNQHYTELIESAKIVDDIVRRDSLHAIINALPDPNYATLRALTLHLHRVEEHSEANRMTSSTLAVIFAPTLMGPHHGSMADASLQPKVIETVLQNALQIFDDD